MEIPDSTTDLTAARIALSAERAALDQREIEIDEETIRRDTAAHQTLLSQCREAKSALERLDFETEDAKDKFRRADNARKSANWYLEQHRSTYPPTTAYASPDELMEWDDELRRLAAAEEAADSASGEAWAALEPLQHRRRTARKAFAELTEQEREAREGLSRLRAELARRKPFSGDKRDATAERATFVFTNSRSHPGGNRLPMRTATE